MYVCMYVCPHPLHAPFLIQSRPPCLALCRRYFDEFLPDHSSEPPSAKGVALLRDPCPTRRTATTIDWHPDGPSRVAVAYSVMRFQVRNDLFVPSSCMLPSLVAVVQPLRLQYSCHHIHTL